MTFHGDALNSTIRNLCWHNQACESCHWKSKALLIFNCWKESSSLRWWEKVNRPGKMGGIACKIRHLSNSDFHLAKPFYFTNPRVIYVLSGAKMHISMLLRGVVTFQGLKSSIHASNIRLIVLLAGPIPTDFLVIGYLGGLVSKVKSCMELQKKCMIFWHFTLYFAFDALNTSIGC